jgi:hypothetical protein
MTGEIPPCQTTAVVDPRDPGTRDRDQGRPRRPRPPVPSHRPDPEPAAAEYADPAHPPHIGTRINVRV